MASATNKQSNKALFSTNKFKFMKKYLLNSCSLLLLFGFVVFSCTKSNAKTELTIEDFRTDKLLQLVVDNMQDLAQRFREDDKAMTITAFGNYKNAIQLLINRYGKDNIKSYIKTLKHEEASFSVGTRAACCKKNTDGTVNMGCCNFLEYVEVSVDSFIYCPATPTMYDSPQYWANWSSCVQFWVCLDC
jgi:hypothetical protein